jgi:hypothetical protein
VSRINITIAICVVALALALLGVYMTVDWALGMVVGVWLTKVAGYEQK